MLLDRTANLRKYIVGIGADEPDGAYDDHQNHRQHDGVFGDVLATLIVPELLQQSRHWAPRFSPRVELNFSPLPQQSSRLGP